MSHEPSVDLEGKNQHGETPLLSVLRNKSWQNENYKAVKHAEVLLELGADIGAVDDDGHGFVAQVCRNHILPDDECYHLLAAQLATRTADEKQKLVRSSKIATNLTAFMLACDNSLLKTQRLLRRLTTDINQISTAGVTAYDIALDRAQGIRQDGLATWERTRVIVWENGEFGFANTDISSRTLLFRNELLADKAALEALFRDTITEDDVRKFSHSDLEEKNRTAAPFA